MNTMNPPSVVKKADSLAERLTRVKAMKNGLNQTLRQSVTQARDIGTELTEAKYQCAAENIAWHSWLQKANIGISSATNYIKIAKYWTRLVDHSDFSPSTGLAEALKIVTTFKDNSEHISPAPPSQFCERCQRVGPVKDCPECAALHDLSGERQAGDDSEQEAAAAAAAKAAPKNGAELFKWREFEKEFRHVVKLNDDMAKIAPPALAKEANEHLSAYLKVSSRMYQAVTSQPVPE